MGNENSVIDQAIGEVVMPAAKALGRRNAALAGRQVRPDSGALALTWGGKPSAACRTTATSAPAS